MRIAIALVWVVAAASAAMADDWHAGVNLRSELGTHPVRVDGGVRFGRLDLIAVLDPMFWTDGEADVDVVAVVRVAPSGYGVLAGWRPASIAIGDLRQFQHSLLVGAIGPLPRVGPLELAWGVEVAAVVVKHGGGLPTETLSIGDTSEVGDNINATMFLRVGYARAL